MDEIQDLMERVLRFRDERNWKQFHNAKDLAISLSLEASEVLENFQWKTNEDALNERRMALKEEIADVAMYLLLLSHELGFDIKEAVLEKLEKNAEKYPIEKAYGSRKKYTEY